MSRIAKVGVVALGTGAVVLSGAGLAAADGGAKGAAIGSPGFLSGNVVQVPIHAPIKVCGNTINGVGLLNPVVGNACKIDHKKDDKKNDKKNSMKNSTKSSHRH